MQGIRLIVFGAAVVASFFWPGVGAPPSWGRPLTATERAEFVRSFVLTCLRGVNRRADILDYGGKEADYESYCHCAGNYFARVKSFEQQEPTVTQNTGAFKTCLRKVLGKSWLMLAREKYEREFIGLVEREMSSMSIGDPRFSDDLRALNRCVAHASAAIEIQEKDLVLGAASRAGDPKAVLAQALRQCQPQFRRIMGHLKN